MPRPTCTLWRWRDIRAIDARVEEEPRMCRSIKTLYNFEPPATEAEIRASAVQFVRKLSGFTKPSQANDAAFARAVDQVTRTMQELLDALVTSAPPRNREAEASKARARAAGRYAGSANPTPSS
jgi:hypothetical protein